MKFKGTFSRSALLAVILGGSFSGIVAATHGYREPQETLIHIVDRPATPAVTSSPDGAWLLLLERPNLPRVAELAEPELRLAGLRFKPTNNGPSRRRPFMGLELLRIADGERRPIRGLPAEARIGDVSFSPDGQHIAFTHTTSGGIELWVASAATGEARRLGDAELNLSARERPAWTADSRSLLALLVVEGEERAPSASMVPEGPVIQENRGSKAPARTFQDLLKNPHDEALFEHYLTSQPARIDLDGRTKPLGEPAIYWSFDPSPDGRFLLVEMLHRPFSYLVPAYRFPKSVEVWDLKSGERIQVAELPLREDIPIAFGSVAKGPRSISWRADADATLTWVEALDGGDAAREAEHRDQLFLWPAPFDGEKIPWAKLEKRFLFLQWGRDDLALAWENWRKTRNLRISRVFPGNPEKPAEVLIDRSWEDRYNDPGRPVTVADDRGRYLLRTGPGGESIYLIGEGASPEGNRPFFDLYDLKTKTSERLFHSAAPYYERPVEPLDPEGRFLLTRRESVEDPPNFFVRDLHSKKSDANKATPHGATPHGATSRGATLRGAALRRLTDFEHPTPELRGLYKELVHYQRADGVKLTGTLYLPPGQRPEDGPLPLLMWAYPREYKSSDSAGQVSDSPYRFDRISWASPLLWLTQGYAVFDDASMPIIGEGEDEPNDTFREQLVANARAAVDELVRRGITQPGQIAVGGHSYGAFMTANLLAHSDLFATGIARSGAYNRTLTPFGFQSEDRNLWEAPEIYFGMSPFMHAEKINEPILLIHGAADNNSGTFPMQSERFYNALKGHGATARLVMLPHESHGYRARESVLHMLWETERWLAEYIRDAAQIETPTVVRGSSKSGRP